MFQVNKAISVVCILLLSTPVHAALIARDSNQTLTYRPQSLPTGRSIFGLRADFIQSSKRLNNKGEKENLGQMFEEKVVDSEGTHSQRYELEASYLQLTPYWGYGLTPSWSLYFGLPLYQVQTKTKNTERNSSPQNIAADSVKSKGRAPDAPQDESGQMLVGQAVLSTQYLITNRVDHKLGFVQKLRFPSAGRDDSIYFTHGTPEALGYGLGVGLNYEYSISAGFNFISSAEGLLNFSDDIYVQQSSNLIEADRNPGDIFTLRATLEKSIFKSSYMQIGVSLEQKTDDEFDLAIDDSDAYEEAEAQRLLIAYEYRPENIKSNYGQNTISGRVSYSYLLSGENVAAENSAAVELRIAY